MTKKNTATTKAIEKQPNAYKQEITRAENIGHALTAEEKIKAANGRIQSAQSEFVRELLGVYITGNQKKLPVKALKGIHAATGENSDLYKATVLKLYASAADYADCITNKDPAGTKAADKPLFDAWKEYLALFNEGETKVAPARMDTATLYAAITKSGKEAVAYTRYIKKNGEAVARKESGVSATMIAPLDAFTRNIERIAAERVMGFDEVVARAKSREIAKANKAKRETAANEKVAEKHAA